MLLQATVMRAFSGMNGHVLTKQVILDWRKVTRDEQHHRDRERRCKVLVLLFNRSSGSTLVKTVLYGWRRIVDVRLAEDRWVIFSTKPTLSVGRSVTVEAFRIWREGATLAREIHTTAEALRKARDRSCLQV